MAKVRYIVEDVDGAVEFYTKRLGFSLARQFGPAMAIVVHEDLELCLAGPPASASKPMPDGARPVPGGWSRIVLAVEDLDAVVARLTAAGVKFRNQIVAGPGGRQVLCVDPSGNAVELFEAQEQPRPNEHPRS
jgi:predicted enzyme related to lactoylglutathione lyase